MSGGNTAMASHRPESIEFADGDLMEIYLPQASILAFRPPDQLRFYGFRVDWVTPSQMSINRIPHEFTGMTDEQIRAVLGQPQIYVDGEFVTYSRTQR